MTKKKKSCQTQKKKYAGKFKNPKNPLNAFPDLYVKSVSLIQNTNRRIGHKVLEMMGL